MTWLERLKALPAEGNGLPRHRQNRQDPGSVSFDSAEVSRIAASEGYRDADATDGAREAYEERAAIMEYDGGQSRADAEQAARTCELERGQALARGKQGADDGDAGGDGVEFRDRYARAREAREPSTSDGVRVPGISAPSARAHARAREGGSPDPVASQLDEWGDMRPCTWCRNLMRSGRCMAAWRGELRAARDYAPTFPEQPRRCYFYDPRGRDPDMSTGRERWSELASWQVRIG